MKKKAVIILIALFFINILYSQNLSESKKKIQNENLYDLIGLNITSEKVQSYIKTLGKFKIQKFGTEIKDYCFENSGIQFRTEKDGNISVIFCYNKNDKLINQPVAFKGKLPFGLSFKNNLIEIQKLIGEGNIINRYGFYGRTFQWIIQDKYKVAMEIRLSENENDKNIFINFISLSKN